MAEKRIYIPTLDGWRAVAVGLVLLAHMFYGHGWVGHFGGLGVKLFFAISGYLICTLLLNERANRSGISLRRFYWRRFFRILPAAFLFLAVIAILANLGFVRAPNREIVEAALMVANYRPNPEWATGHYWSLAIEEHFYLLWPPLLAYFGNRAARNIGIALSLAVAGWRVWAPSIAGVEPFYRTDERLDALCLACVLAIVLFDDRWRHRFARFLHPVTCLLLILSMAFTTKIAHENAFLESASLFYESAALPLIVVSTVLHPTILSKILGLSPLRWLGRISYSLYLWQQPFFQPPNSLRSLPLKLAGALACATLSYYFVERPVIRHGQRLSIKWHSGRARTSQQLAEDASRPATSVTIAPAPSGDSVR